MKVAATIQIRPLPKDCETFCDPYGTKVFNEAQPISHILYWARQEGNLSPDIKLHVIHEEVECESEQ